MQPVGHSPLLHVRGHFAAESFSKADERHPGLRAHGDRALQLRFLSALGVYQVNKEDHAVYVWRLQGIL